MKKDTEYDLNVLKALKQLQVPLVTWSGTLVYFDKDKRYESIYEHIANKKHHLTVKDINEIPVILRNKKALIVDRSGRKFHTYSGRRGKKKDKLKYLKIITSINGNKKESIVTVYLTKKIE